MERIFRRFLGLSLGVKELAFRSSCLYSDIREECEKMTHTSFEQDKDYLKERLGPELNGA